MEKIIYLLGNPSCGSFLERLKPLVSGSIATIVAAAGGRLATLHTADHDAWISTECPSRQMGDVASINAVLAVWLPSAHQAEPITDELQHFGGLVHAYVVSEAVWQADNNPVGGGQLRPGISFVTCLRRNPTLDDSAFYTYWDEHSIDSAALHPLRESYARHAVVRPITHDAPALDGIVFEHFPSRAVFADDEKFFDVEFAQQIAAHTLQMIHLDSLRSNGYSQYQYGD